MMIQIAARSKCPGASRPSSRQPRGTASPAAQAGPPTNLRMRLTLWA